MDLAKKGLALSRPIHPGSFQPNELMPIILTFSICSILVLSSQDIDPLAGILAVLLVRDAEHQAQCPLIPAAPRVQKKGICWISACIRIKGDESCEKRVSSLIEKLKSNEFSEPEKE